MRKGLIDPDEEHRLRRDLAKRLDPQAVLDHYGADNAYEQVTQEGETEVIHSCLIDRVEPHHSNGDANPSASCNLDHGLYVCYSYHDPDPDPRYNGKSGMDMIRLVMKLEGKTSVHDVKDLLAPYLSGATPERDDMLASWGAVFAPADRTARRPAYRTYSRRTLEPWAFIHPYLATRGIDADTASELDIGYDISANRITIPHFVGGALVGWQKRAIPERPGEWPGTKPDLVGGKLVLPKYKNSPGFPKSSSLYRADDIGRSRVVVVESPFSVIRSVARGDGIPVVATFGAKITEEQTALLADYRQVIVWMDDGDAGESATVKLWEALRRHTDVRVILPDEGMDLGDYETSEAVHAKIDGALSQLDIVMEVSNG